MKLNRELMPEDMLPVDIVLSPAWWYRHTGITFDEDFFFHPARRVEAEAAQAEAEAEALARATAQTEAVVAQEDAERSALIARSGQLAA